MKKLEMNKKTIIIFTAIAVAIIAIIVGILMCEPKEEEGSKNTIKTEQKEENDKKDDVDNTDNEIIDHEGGLSIKGPEDMEKEEVKTEVEFVNPDGTKDTEDKKDELETEETEEEDSDDILDDEIPYGGVF